MAAMTTIKVSPALRDRVNRDANARGLTAAQLLTELVDDYERRKRLEAFGQSFASADVEYHADTRSWDLAQTQWPHA